MALLPIAAKIWIQICTTLGETKEPQKFRSHSWIDSHIKGAVGISDIFLVLFNHKIWKHPSEVRFGLLRVSMSAMKCVETSHVENSLLSCSQHSGTFHLDVPWVQMPILSFYTRWYRVVKIEVVLSRTFCLASLKFNIKNVCLIGKKISA